MTVDGRLFHALAAATRNARSPSDDLLVAGTTSADELHDNHRGNKKTLTNAVWAPFERLVEVGRTGRLYMVSVTMARIVARLLNIF